MDDSEWRERIKCRVLEQGWTYPKNPALIGEAMTRVERDVRRVEVPPAPRPVTVAPQRPRDLFRRTPGQASAFTSLADVIGGLKQRRKL